MTNYYRIKKQHITSQDLGGVFVFDGSSRKCEQQLTTTTRKEKTWRILMVGKRSFLVPYLFYLLKYKDC